MTRYIKNKDGKFAGSIGDGKTTVPTIAPALPTPPATEPVAPTPFPRARTFTDYITRHTNAFTALATAGISPDRAAAISRMPQTSRWAVVPGHLAHHVDTPLDSPSTIAERTEALTDTETSQRMTLMQLEEVIDSCEEFADFYREDCEECDEDAAVNTPEMFNGQYCANHDYISRIDNLYDTTPLIERASTAVEEDWLPAGSDRDAVIVMTSLMPDPFAPNPEDTHD